MSHFVCSFKDREVQRDAKMLSYDVVDQNGKPYVQVKVGADQKTFSPEEISAMILGKTKETAGKDNSAMSQDAWLLAWHTSV